jgi:hypothetical protein
MSKWHRLLSGCMRTLIRNLQLQHAYIILRMSGLFNKLGGMKKVNTGRKEAWQGWL